MDEALCIGDGDVVSKYARRRSDVRWIVDDRMHELGPLHMLATDM
jgi:hypothetical protein